ncbi:alpha/beta hydrolase [Bacillus sp. EB600]|nr:alpha/beta hydrolase [Bacillus sp. EB600]
MIHGLTGSHKYMHYYAEKLKGEYRVISLDLRGRGNSDSTDPEPSIFKHAEDIIGLIKMLKLENPILIGHSMGAFISAIVASKLPSVKAVVLLDGAARMSEHQRAIVKPSLGRLSKEYQSKDHYIEEAKQIYSHLGISWNDILQDIVEYEVEPVGDYWKNKSSEAGILGDSESFYTFEVKEICSKIMCPVLLVYAKGEIGAMPPLFYLRDYEDTQAYTKNIETVISDCNHYTMVFENREDINGYIEKFLKKIEA